MAMVIGSNRKGEEAPGTRQERYIPQRAVNVAVYRRTICGE